MNILEAIRDRHSTRAFLPNPVEKDKLTAILEVAARTPSWATTQPWDVFVATGETLERIKQGYHEKYANKTPAAPETTFPSEWSEAAKNRTKQLRPDMIRDCGGAEEQFAPLNQAMFHAPAVVYICMDKVLSEWSLYDIGAYSQSLMLAALAYDLHTIPAITLVLFPDVLRKELQIPENLKITIGIAIGYADQENKINDFISGRSPLEETVRLLD
jgi:nitroreductase